MRKSFVTMLASLIIWAVLPLSTAKAAVYNYTFVSFDGALTLTGQMRVNNAGRVTRLTGAITGLANDWINVVVTDPRFPNPVASPDGSFTYDDLYHTAGPYFDNHGLLFKTVDNATGFWDLFGNFPGNYTLWESIGAGDYAIKETGNLTVLAAPELSTWGMLLAGFAGLAVAARRRGSHPTAINFD